MLKYCNQKNSSLLFYNIYRARYAFTSKEMNVLENFYFLKGKHPNDEERKDLVEKSGLDEHRIKV